MTAFLAYATPDALPLATRCEYFVAPPEPTTREILDRLARRLLESRAPFSYDWEMARHRCLVQVEGMLSREKVLLQLEAQRANLAKMSR